MSGHVLESEKLFVETITEVFRNVTIVAEDDFSEKLEKVQNGDVDGHESMSFVFPGVKGFFQESKIPKIETLVFPVSKKSEGFM